MLINIKTTFKPTFIKNHFFGYYTTKDAIMKDILNGKAYKKEFVPAISKSACYFTTYNGEECVLLFSIEKHRAKTTKTFYKKGEKKGQVKSVETTPTHYVGYKYLIPLSLIRLSGMKVVKTQKGGYKLAKQSFQQVIKA